MKPPLSLCAPPAGDWLVVIDRHQASIFRSTVVGAASQCIRAPQPSDVGMGRVPKSNENGRAVRVSAPGFFEPLAGVLHGARRILIFGRATPLSDETGSFLFWLCNLHPDLVGRIVATVPVDPHDMSDSTLLAKARAFYERNAIISRPPTVAEGAA